MRRVNYLFAVLALGLGLIIGTLGVSLLSGSSSPTSFISKLRGQDKIQPVSGAVSSPEQTSPVSNMVPDVQVGNTAADNTALSPLQQKVISDYKQDIGIFFGAWKSPDMSAFRLKLAQAYTGDLFEKHARRAEEYLVQGLGLDVSKISFDRVDVENAGENTATLRADYSYTARDYNLADAAPVGEEHEQNVHVRVNLVKQNSHWLITGESTVQ